MAEFTYRARNTAGKNLTGTIVADSLDDAKAELRRQGFQILDLGERSRAAGGGGLSLAGLLEAGRNAQLGGAKVKPQDLIVFTRQLATMLSAGIPLLECLEILAEQAEEASFRRIIEQIVEDVRSGSDFSEALRKHPKVFTNIYVSMIRAGEASGQLDEILVRLAEYQEAAAALRGRIKSAMTYPTVSLALIFLIIVGLLIGIIPKFREIFDTLPDVELPVITSMLLDISEWMQNNALVWILGIVVFFIGLKLYAQTRIGGWQLDWIKLRIPIFGPLFQKVAISRFSRTFATLIQAGVPILGALEIVAATAGNRIVEESVLDASTSVRQGETLAAPLAKSKVFPPMVTRMIAIGEKSGALENLLQKISEFYDQQVSATVESLTSLIEPILIFIMGFVVGGMVLAIFLPIFQLTSALRG